MDHDDAKKPRNPELGRGPAWGAAIALGIGIGVALGNGMGNPGAGIAIGIAIAIVFAMTLDPTNSQRAKKGEENPAAEGGSVADNEGAGDGGDGGSP